MRKPKIKDFNNRIVDAIIDQIGSNAAECRRMKTIFHGHRKMLPPFWGKVAEVAHELIQVRDSGFVYLAAMDGSGICLRSHITANALIQLGSHRLALPDERAEFEQSIKWPAKLRLKGSMPGVDASTVEVAQ
jgi:hypothetical protein